MKNHHFQYSADLLPSKNTYQEVRKGAKEKGKERKQDDFWSKCYHNNVTSCFRYTNLFCSIIFYAVKQNSKD